MICQQHELHIDSKPRAFSDFTAEVARLVRASGIRIGLCTVFVRHTSASLLIQENADPAVLRDLARWIAEVAPEKRAWEHDAEGPDDMPAHARSAITHTSESIPISEGELALGTWQALYLWEHRASPHRRQILIHLTGAA